MAQPTIEDILDRLIQIQNNSGASFERLETEVRDLKDNRYRPYFASGAAFLVIVLAVMGYVYNLETRLTTLLFKLNADVSVSSERLNVLEDRLHQRTENIQLRWEAHTDSHRSLSEGMKLLLQEILAHKSDSSENEEPR